MERCNIHGLQIFMGLTKCIPKGIKTLMITESNELAPTIATSRALT